MLECESYECANYRCATRRFYGAGTGLIVTGTRSELSLTLDQHLQSSSELTPHT